MSLFNLLSRLKLWQSFLVLSLLGLLLAAIPSILYLHETSKSLAAYSAEQQGLPAVARTLRLIQLTQQHRGLSAMVLGGAAASEDKRAGAQREVDQTIAAVDSAVRDIGGAELTEVWGGAQRQWEAIRAGVAAKSLSPPQSFAAHTTLLAALLSTNELAPPPPPSTPNSRSSAAPATRCRPPSPGKSPPSTAHAGGCWPPWQACAAPPPGSPR
jgi:hypothetical protein